MQTMQRRPASCQLPSQKPLVAGSYSVVQRASPGIALLLQPSAKNLPCTKALEKAHKFLTGTLALLLNPPATLNPDRNNITSPSYAIDDPTQAPTTEAEQCNTAMRRSREPTQHERGIPEHKCA